MDEDAAIALALEIEADELGFVVTDFFIYEPGVFGVRARRGKNDPDIFEDREAWLTVKRMIAEKEAIWQRFLSRRAELPPMN